MLLQFAGQDEIAVNGATASLWPEVGAVGMMLIRDVAGAVVPALAAGFVTYQMLRRVDNYQVEVLLTLALAMGLYALADALHLSAPIVRRGRRAADR